MRLRRAGNWLAMSLLFVSMPPLPATAAVGVEVPIAIVAATLGVGRPSGLAIHPTGTGLYVTNYVENTVSVLDLATRPVTATVGVLRQPAGIAIHPAGTQLDVAYVWDDTVSVLDTGANVVLATVPVGSGPTGVALHPTGARVYVTNAESNMLAVLDPAMRRATARIKVGPGPAGVAINRAGTGVNITHYLDQTLSVLDPVTHCVTAMVEEVGWNPRDLAVAPTGSQVYVANLGNSIVTVLDTTVSVMAARWTQAPPWLVPAGFPRIAGDSMGRDGVIADDRSPKAGRRHAAIGRPYTQAPKGSNAPVMADRL